MRSGILGFTAGALLLQHQATLPASPHLLFWLLPPMLLAGGMVWRGRALPKPVRGLAQLATGVFLGFVWAALVAQLYLMRELPTEWEGRDMVVIGRVDSLPMYGDQSVRFQFAIEEVLSPGEAPASLPPRVALSWFVGSDAPDANSANPALRMLAGERWQLTLRLRRPHGNANPEGFDYEVWLLEQNLRATGYVVADGAPSLPNQRLASFVFSPRAVVERARGWIRDRILSQLDGKPYAGVIVALVIGDQRGIEQSDWKVFNRTGVGHLMSISGLHITMISGLVAGLVAFLWRRSFFTRAALPLRLPTQQAAAIAGASAALVYVLLAGFGVPAQRTLYMLLVVAAALWYGRLTRVSHVLCLALGVVIVLDPWAVLWPGFWLSFGAVGLILYATVGRAAADAGTPTSSLRQMLQTGAYTQYVVTIGLIPLTMLLFGQCSLVSPLANAIAIPLVSFLITPLALLGSLMPSPLAAPVLQLAHWLLEGLAAVLGSLSALPAAVWSAPFPAWWMFALALVGVVWLLAPAGWPARWLGLLCLLPMLTQPAAAPGAGEMWVTAFDVGQGMALLVETPQRRLLYDTGPSYSPATNAATRVILPYLRARGIDRLDGLIVSHSDNDHAGGALSLLEEIDVKWVMSSLPETHPIAAASRAHRHCEAGQGWEWDGVRFDVLHPDGSSYAQQKTKANARSCTLKVSLGQRAILLAGDIESAQEADLLSRDPEQLRATVLLAPHHGSGTSSTRAFLEAVAPELALFQVGYRNRYRHPKPEIVERYADLGIRRLRSDEAGAVTLHFGAQLDVVEYRKQHARYWYGR